MTGRSRACIVAAGLLVAVASGAVLIAQQNKREISVTAKKYTYSVPDANGPEIRVSKNDLVTIALTASDIPHSFTISDYYRIDRRAEPGKTVTFSFRADKVGEFEIRCTLTVDERCARDMKGKLIVVDGK